MVGVVYCGVWAFGWVRICECVLSGKVLPIIYRAPSRQGRGRNYGSLAFAWRGGIVGGVDYRKIITIEPGKRSGKPCIRGMRITVTDVLEYLAGGMSVQEILSDFPELTEEDIRACLAFAADRERRLAQGG